MVEVFQSTFRRDPWAREGECKSYSAPSLPGLRQLFDQFGGASFRGGLYRIVHPADLMTWQDRIHFAYPEFEGRIFCFGFDWLGRVFALDIKRTENGQAGVVMFEPGTGEALEIPSNLQSFHEAELIEFGEAALAISFHAKWLAAGGAMPRYDQCIGYRMPLFFGGADEVENLEASDIDVYWHLTGQLILQTKGLPKGTTVRVNIDSAE
jgi:Domain of unknown function (DUF1851)